MAYVKPTSTGKNFLQKIHTPADVQKISTVQQYEKQSGSQGASSYTVFTLAKAYVPGSNTLMVFVNGQKAVCTNPASSATQYEETDSNTITFGASLQATDVIEFIVAGTYQN